MRNDEAEPLLYENRHNHREFVLKKVARYCCYFILFVLFVYALLITIITPILWATFTQTIAQNALNAAQATFHSTVMMNPTGSIGGDVAETTLTVLYQDIPFGYLDLPNTTTPDSNAPLIFQQKAKLTVFNDAVFREQASVVLAGGSIQWRLSGPVNIKVKQLGLTLSLSLHIEKDVTIYGKKLVNVTAYDVTPLSGTQTTLMSTAWQSLYNPSVISLVNMGDLKMQAFTYPSNVYLGDVFIQNFTITQGFNSNNNIRVSTVKTSYNIREVEAFLSQWTMGVDQTISMQGPVETSTNSSFLLYTSNILVVVKGNTNTRLVHNITAGNPKYPFGEASQYVYNPLPINTSQSNFRFQIYQDPESCGYTGFNANIHSKTPYSCPTGTSYGPWVSTARFKVPAKTIEVLTFISAPPTNALNCDSYRPIATCCNLIQKNITEFTVSVSGTFIVTLEKFRFTQTYSQSNVPLFCYPDASLWNQYYCPPFLNETCVVPDESIYCNTPLFLNRSDFPPPPSPSPSFSVSPIPSHSVSPPKPTSSPTISPTASPSISPPTSIIF